MRNLFDHLVRLGESRPHLRPHLRPILDHVCSSPDHVCRTHVRTQKARRPQPVGLEAVAGAVDRTLGSLHLGHYSEEGGGNLLHFYLVPDPSDFLEEWQEAEGGFVELHKSFTDAQLSAIKGQYRQALEEVVSDMGYIVTMYDVENGHARMEVDKDHYMDGESDWTQVLHIELQPYYPEDHWTPLSLIREGTPYLYHVTDQKWVDSIRSRGLIPRGSRESEFIYPDRVYLFKDRGAVKAALRDFVPRSHTDQSSKTLTSTPEVAILMVDLTEVRRGTKFYEDPSYPGDTAVFTYTHIPSEAITRVINKDMSR